MLQPELGAAVARVVDDLERDVKRDAGSVDLWNAVSAAFELICEEPESQRARRRVIRVYPEMSQPPLTLFGVDIRTRDHNWIMLWRPDKGLDGDDVALVVYLGDYTIPH